MRVNKQNQANCCVARTVDAGAIAAVCTCEHLLPKLNECTSRGFGYFEMAVLQGYASANHMLLLAQL